MINDQALFEKVAKESSCTELYEVVKTYRGWRSGSGDNGTETTITLQLNRQNGDWIVHAKNSRGQTATGNPEKAPALALSFVHWRNLDIQHLGS